MHCWGWEKTGSCTQGTKQYRDQVPELKAAVAVAIGMFFDCTINGDGDMHCWDFSHKGKINEPCDYFDSGLKWATASLSHETGFGGCGITKNGALHC